jgi:hypothetical protein
MLRHSLERILAPALAAAALAIYLLLASRKSSNPHVPIDALSKLKRRTMGRAQWQIEKQLGRPRTILAGPAPIWYYAVDPRQHLAMAISFRNERATGIEFFTPSALPIPAEQK